jgi:hypothetical protein
VVTIINSRLSLNRALSSNMAIFIISLKSLHLKIFILSPIRVRRISAGVADAADKYIVFFLKVSSVSAGKL